MESCGFELFGGLVQYERTPLQVAQRYAQSDCIKLLNQVTNQQVPPLNHSVTTTIPNAAKIEQLHDEACCRACSIM